VLGTAIPVNHLLAKTDDVAVVVGTLNAYPNGFVLRVTFRLRPPAPLDAMHGGHLAAMRTPALGPRFGLEFSDGRRVGDQPSGGLFDVEKDDNGIPTAPVLIPQGGGGSSGHWDQDFWVWPLPSAGPLVVHFAWADQDIDESSFVLDGAEIRAAGENATELWSTGRDPEPGPRDAGSGGTWRRLRSL
jgi:hypothetical protein